MAVIAVNDRVLVSFVGRLNSQRTINTFLYRVQTAAADADYFVTMENLLENLGQAGNLRSAYIACLPDNWVGEFVWVQVIKPTRLRKVQDDFDSVGQWPHEANTSNLQGSVTRAGDIAGRKAIGGVRIPIATNSATISNGLIVPQLVTLLQALAAEMEEPIALANPNVTLVPQVGVPKGLANSLDLGSAFAQNTARVIRRRTVGLGE